MIETLIGTLLGGVFRLIPEGIKVFEKRNEQKHELLMFDKQLEADKLKATYEKDKLVVQNEGAATLAELQGVIEATKAQAQLTGNKFIDGINSLVRPLITFWWVIVMYSVALSAQFAVAYAQGDGAMKVISGLWGQDEKAIVASIMSFWFVDRSIRKAK